MRVRRVAKAKKASMESALEAFGKAAGYGIVDVTTAATYHIAAIYHQFGRDLMAAEKPAGLSEEELEALTNMDYPSLVGVEFNTQFFVKKSLSKGKCTLHFCSGLTQHHE